MVVTGVEKFGIFVQGVDLPAEGLIHIDTLDDDHYDYDEAVHSLVGRRLDLTAGKSRFKSRIRFTQQRSTSIWMRCAKRSKFRRLV